MLAKNGIEVTKNWEEAAYTELRQVLAACSGNDDLTRYPSWSPWSSRESVSYENVEAMLRDGGIGYTVQALFAYCRTQANLLVVLVGNFSRNQDMCFIHIVAAMRRVRAVKHLVFRTRWCPDKELCEAERMLADDDQANKCMVAKRHNLTVCVHVIASCKISSSTHSVKHTWQS